MPIGKNLRRILGPFVFLFGLCLLAGYAWILVTAHDKSIGTRLFGALFATLFSFLLIFVGYDWMRGRVSMKFPKLPKDETDDS
jgi:hypothetical protein